MVHRKSTIPKHISYVPQDRINHALDELIAHKRRKYSKSAKDIANKYHIGRTTLYRYYKKWRELPQDKRFHHTLLYSDDNKN